MRPEARISYSTPSDRPPSALPNGAKVAIWPVVNVENWLIENPMPRQVLVAPTGVALHPDVANWGWHEYGMRVGFWRFLEAFEKRGIRPTLSVNGSVCTAYPRVARAAHAAGWDFMGHNHVQIPTHKVADQRAMIAEAIAAITACTGAPPLGWLAPGLTETLDTPDLLAEAEAGNTPRIMCIAIHPYITGVPHRIAALEQLLDDLAAMPGIAFMQAREILEWYEGCGDPT